MRFTVEAGEFILAFVCLFAIGYFFPLDKQHLRADVPPTPHRFHLKVTYAEPPQAQAND